MLNKSFLEEFKSDQWSIWCREYFYSIFLQLLVELLRGRGSVEIMGHRGGDKAKCGMMADWITWGPTVVDGTFGLQIWPILNRKKGLMVRASESMFRRRGTGRRDMRCRLKSAIQFEYNSELVYKGTARSIHQHYHACKIWMWMPKVLVYILQLNDTTRGFSSSHAIIYFERPALALQKALPHVINPHM